MTSFTSLIKASWQAMVLLSVFVLGGVVVDGIGHVTACERPIYLTFDTGSMSQAELILNTLAKHDIKATFFVANEKTIQNDHSLDHAWQPFWQRVAQKGHALASHTFDHVYWRASLSNDRHQVMAQFGTQAGRLQTWDAAQICHEIERSQNRLKTMLGSTTIISPFWRAPGGKGSQAYWMAVQKQCGLVHVHWSSAGFLGDELPSNTHPNADLLRKAVQNLKTGSITVAHLGIWSRKDPWAPTVLEPLIIQLKQKGFCFQSLTQHPKIKGKTTHDFKHLAEQNQFVFLP